MRIRKLGSVLIVAVILMLGLCACEPEVITVADIQEGQEAQYIEVQEFTLKEVVRQTIFSIAIFCSTTEQ